MFQTEEMANARPRGGVNLVMLGGTAKEHRTAKVVRDEAGEGLDLQWSPQRWGSLGTTLGSHGRLQSKGGLVCMTPLGWVP